MFNKKQTGQIIFWGKLTLALWLVVLNVGVAGAEPATTPAPAADSTSTSSSSPGQTSLEKSGMNQFNVGQYLTVNDLQQTNNAINDKVNNVGLQGAQEQKYLKENSNPVGAFILQIINLIALSSASLSFLAVVIAGFLMMSAAGNENQLNQGKDILTKALVGLVITLSAYFIVAFVQNLLFETVSK